jgi:hypothetical protein
MADPVVVTIPAITGSSVSLDTSGFDSKLATTDNLVQELADAFDDHTHGMAELTDFVPPNDNLTDLGATDKRWKDIYAGNALIQTSDRTVKTDIEPLTNAWSFVEGLRPVSFRFVGGKRTHTGFIAQDVGQWFADNRKDYAMFCKSSSGLCGLRYEEAIAPLTWCVQDLRDSVCILSRQAEHADEQVSVVSERVEMLWGIAHEIEDKCYKVTVDQRVDFEKLELSVAELRKEIRALATNIFDRVSRIESTPAQEAKRDRLPLILGASGFVMGLVAMIASLT